MKDKFMRELTWSAEGTEGKTRYSESSRHQMSTAKAKLLTA